MQDARDRLHQDHRLRVPASGSLSEGRTQYTGGPRPGVSRRCQSPRTNPALTTGRGPVASVRRRAALESWGRLVPLELPGRIAPDVNVELVEPRIVAVVGELDLELHLLLRSPASRTPSKGRQRPALPRSDRVPDLVACRFGLLPWLARVDGARLAWAGSCVGTCEGGPEPNAMGWDARRVNQRARWQARSD